MTYANFIPSSFGANFPIIAIFNAIRTWEEARRANAFPTHIRKMLQNPALSWRLERKADNSGWTLYQMENGMKGCSFEL